MQFHTPESLEAKELTHKAYESASAARMPLPPNVGNSKIIHAG